MNVPNLTSPDIRATSYSKQIVVGTLEKCTSLQKNGNINEKVPHYALI